MRIADRGLIDRGRPLAFTFDGRAYAGFAGDTLASALLANGVRLLGRSFKYHRPRGVMTAGPEEPNALVTIGSGAQRMPNTRATVQPLFDGLEAYSQNRWPSLSHDVLGVNDLLSPWLSAGFYYKTFLWPPAFWTKLWEPMIRRAAGLGALPGAPDGLPRDKAFAFCDLLVIGGGPAGLMAALVAGRAGADVILADETDRPGGRLLSEVEQVGGCPAAQWAEAAVAELSALPNVRLMPRTSVTGAYDQGTYGALERSDPLAGAPDAPVETFWRIVTRRSILAAGAIERPIAFANNDRPGVMLAGALRSYLNRYGVAPGQRVVVFGNNDDAHRTARDLAAAGVEVAALVDSRPDARAEDAAYPVHAGAVVIETRGRKGLRQVILRRADGAQQAIAADCLAISGGWSPSVHLSCHLGASPLWNPAISAFVPAPDAVPGMQAAGSANGALSTAACLSEGADAAVQALAALGQNAPAVDLPVADDDGTPADPLWEVPGKGRAWLDFQNDVTVKDVRQAAQENFRSVEHMKRYTTQGMATDQGKLSSLGALAVLADATGRSIAETGTTTFRPPYTPVGIAAMGAGADGPGLAPERHSATFDAAEEKGAPMVETGLWLRPAWYPRTGETTWRDSCDREVAMVRNSVGVADVSTLGKIDVQGPDAGAFLDFVYANRMASLPVGRIRYGLMLREDGHVMDDGTVARLADSHFMVTTTTAAAGSVMTHLEFVRQGLRSDLDVQISSATEHWAQIAVAGPLAAQLVAAVLDDDAGGMRFMSWIDARICGVAGRVFRISFSGELGFELAVPARYGDSLFRLLASQAEHLGGGVYGGEALNVLRIEKGFLTHAEIDGRVTAEDIGLGRMISAEKDCIGKTMAARPGLTAPDRPQLIGLKAVQGDILAGAHLLPEDAGPTGLEARGHVSSAAYSPTLGTGLALGFLPGGRARLGQSVRAVDQLRQSDTLCEIVHPVFFDPDGGRARG